MGIIHVKFPERHPYRSMHVDVDRSVRHRGEYSLYNFFLIGRHKDSPLRYRLYLRPYSYIERWQWQMQLESDGMVKWAEGTLTPKDMLFHSCDDAVDAYTLIARIVSLAFNPRNSDERLEEFYGAQISLPFLSDKQPKFTVASVIGPNNKL